MVRAFIGLGSNVGDRLANLGRAVDELRLAEGISVGLISSVYDTDPVGPPQPNFLNAVVEVKTDLEPRALLAVLKGIERRLGRSASERWGPRKIDLDLLLFGDEVIAEDDLKVPHPEMWSRAFVIVPLAEIAPDLADASGVDRTSVRFDADASSLGLGDPTD